VYISIAKNNQSHQWLCGGGGVCRSLLLLSNSARSWEAAISLLSKDRPIEGQAKERNMQKAE